MHKVYLKPGKEESLKRFHPWVFSGAIARIEGKPEEGEIVEVGTPRELKLKYAKDSVSIIYEDEKEVIVKKDMDDIIKELKKNHHKQIQSIHSQEPNLAEIFLSLTGRELK